MKRPTESLERVAPRIEHGIASRPWWPWVRRLLKIAFFAAVGYLLLQQARSVEWDEVFAIMRQHPKQGLLLAALLAACSHLLYSCFDLLGRHITGHTLRTRQVMTVNFISFAFNLNMGTIVGGVAFRYRLYSQLGLTADVVTRVVGMSILTNWLGYLLLAGLLFWWWPIALPAGWHLDMRGQQWLGFALFATAACYVLLCARARRRSWTIKSYQITLPSMRLALLQLLMSCVNWLLNTGVLYMLMQRKVAFTEVLGTLLVSAIAGVLAHIPAGLGVLEAVFVALLSSQLPRSELLAALLAYRAIYYLIPLAVASVVYLVFELRAKAAAALADERA
jgi:glycosyltransferase 2 family protein